MLDLAIAIEQWEARGEMDDIERDAMADSGLYQDIDPSAPNYWRALSLYGKAGALRRIERKGV